MRHYKIMALCLSMLVIPTVATAQTNVKKAFDKFLNSSKVVYTERHSLDKDPETNEKSGQYDIYEYTISAKDKSRQKIFCVDFMGRVDYYKVERTLFGTPEPPLDRGGGIAKQ